MSSINLSLQRDLRAEGTTFRLVISTLGWFDPPSGPAQPRPDLAALATHLNELEGSAPDEAVAWRHQDAGGIHPGCKSLFFSSFGYPE